MSCELMDDLRALRVDIVNLSGKLDAKIDLLSDRLESDMRSFVDRIERTNDKIDGLETWVKILDMKIKIVQWIGTSAVSIIAAVLGGFVVPQLLGYQSNVERLKEQSIEIKNAPSDIPGRRVGGGTRRGAESK